MYKIVNTIILTGIFGKCNRINILNRLIDSDIIRVVKYLKKTNNQTMGKYIWYCERTSCNAIVLKTTEPIPIDGNYKCKRCNVIYTANQLVTNNKGNIRKYLEHIDKK